MVWKFVNAAGGLVAGLDGEVSACRFLDVLQPSIEARDERPREPVFMGHTGNGVNVEKTRETESVANDRLLQDELKLLRVRTKKQELVIVPDTKYLLIVIHETPAA